MNFLLINSEDLLRKTITFAKKHQIMTPFRRIINILLTTILIASSSFAYSQISNKINFLEAPGVYEGKTSTSFKVLQVFDGYALSREISNKELNLYLGKTVLIEGDLFYDEQEVSFESPMLIGIYKYGLKTVPVVRQSAPSALMEKKANGKATEVSDSAKDIPACTWILDGRSIRGPLPLPVYSDRGNGFVVIGITVNEKGEVIEAEIAPGTDITAKSLQVSAISAAKQTRFNAIEAEKNQKGTITYRFEMK